MKTHDMKSIGHTRVHISSLIVYIKLIGHTEKETNYRVTEYPCGTPINTGKGPRDVSLPLLGFLLLGQNTMTKEQVGEKRVYLAYTSRL